MTGYAFPDMLVDVVNFCAQDGNRDTAHDLFDAHLPLIRYEQQQGIGLAVRKYVLQKRGAIAHDTQRAPAGLTAAARAEIDSAHPPRPHRPASEPHPDQRRCRPMTSRRYALYACGRSAATPNARSSAMPACAHRSLPRTAARRESRHTARVAAGRTSAADSSDRAPSRYAPLRPPQIPRAASARDGHVKFVITRNSSRSMQGTSNRSTSREQARSISIATLRRNLSACTKSTAERNRDWRKVFGHASGTCIFNSSRPCRSARRTLQAMPPQHSGDRMMFSGVVQPIRQRAHSAPPSSRVSSPVSSAARSTSVAGAASIHCRDTPTRKPRRIHVLPAASNSAPACSERRSRIARHRSPAGQRSGHQHHVLHSSAPSLPACRNSSSASSRRVHAARGRT